MKKKIVTASAHSIRPKGQWLGLSDGRAEAVWRWTTTRILEWSDWGPGSPNGVKVENCAVWNTGGWDDLRCHLKQPFLCQSARCEYRREREERGGGGMRERCGEKGGERKRWGEGWELRRERGLGDGW